MSNQPTRPENTDIDPNLRWAELDGSTDPSRSEQAPDPESELSTPHDEPLYQDQPLDTIESGIPEATTETAFSQENHEPINRISRKRKLITGVGASIAAVAAVTALVLSGGPEDEEHRENEGIATEATDEDGPDTALPEVDTTTPEVAEEHETEIATPGNEIFQRYTVAEIPEKFDFESGGQRTLTLWSDTARAVHFRGEMVENQENFMKDVLNYYQELVDEGAQLEVAEGLSFLIRPGFIDEPVEIVRDPVIFSVSFKDGISEVWHIPSEASHTNYILLFPAAEGSEEIVATTIQDEGIGWQTQRNDFLGLAMLSPDVSIQAIDTSAGETPGTTRQPAESGGAAVHKLADDDGSRPIEDTGNLQQILTTLTR